MVPELDHLQYLDHEISSAERAHVEELIRREMSQNGVGNVHNMPVMHPTVTRILPVTIGSSGAGTGPEQEPVYGGIDIDRYTSPNHIYTTLSYAQLQERNLDMYIENQGALSAIQDQYIGHLESITSELGVNNNRKRVRLEAVEEARKRKQLEEYGPQTDLLNARWREGIEGVVDMAVELNSEVMETSKQ